MEYTDILPTFIELAGGKTPENLDGESLVPLFNKPEKKIKEYSYSIQTTRGIANGSDYYGSRAIVNNQYRYIWNLTPEVKFKNNVTDGNAGEKWYDSWVKKSQNDFHAQKILHKYSQRPPEELYDVISDKWCMKNLADDPKYSHIKSKLREELLKWMDECGDNGQQTELEAYKHMPGKN